MKSTLKLKLLLLLILPLLIYPAKIYAQKTMTAVRISVPPVIDGVPDDSIWAEAPPVSDFLQQEPVPGAKPSEKTVVKILYDDKNLYVSFMCYDDEPDKIIARELKLDGKWSGDDNISIIFDTFNDNRTGYWFGTNPLGMRDDILLSSGSGIHVMNEDWNGIWHPVSAITDSGWSTEIVFPFSTFKFYDKPVQQWGINFQRRIQRKGETVQWNGVGKDADFFRLSFAGNLSGIKNIKRGNPIYLKPFFTGGAQYAGGERTFVHKPGLDIKYGITETLSLDLTFNTDFAQVESDRARINLTRFPLFYPEKRDFFLEGANIFKFSLGGNDQLFYSRRIGIHNGEEIPIIAGAKLVGRVKGAEIGFIDMQTNSKGSVPTTNYGVVRGKFDIFNQSYAGVFFSSVASKNGFNRVYGADAVLTTSEFLDDKTLSFGANIAKTDETGGTDNSLAGKFYLDYPNDLIDQYLSYGFIQKNFNPGIGFISRTGIQTYDYNLNISPRVNWGAIKKLRFAPVESGFDFSMNNELLAAGLTFQPFGIITVQGDQLSFEINRDFDRVDRTFHVFENAYIDKGKYWMTSYGISYQSASSRIVYGQLEASTGDYYSGTRKSFSAALTFSPGSHFALYTDYSHNSITLADSKFQTNEVGVKVNYDFSTAVNSSVFTQWNNELEELNFNYRVKWEPKVGSNFYLVINHLISTHDKIVSKDFAVLAKFVWMFVI